MDATQPDPTDTVTILASDFALLQKVADFAVADAAALAELLNLPCPEGTAPRQHFHLVLLPRVGHLLFTQVQVNEASEKIGRAAARFGNKTIEHKGVKGVKVGQRDPELARLLSLQTPPSRAERRRMRDR